MYEDMPIGTSVPKVRLPRICIDQDALPELKGATIGKVFTLAVTCEVVELSKRSYDTADRKDMVHADLQVTTLSVKGGE